MSLFCLFDDLSDISGFFSMPGISKYLETSRGPLHASYDED